MVYGKYSSGTFGSVVGVAVGGTGVDVEVGMTVGVTVGVFVVSLKGVRVDSTAVAG
jgi:hypothetical protein